MFTRILVPTDFSGPSDSALDYARTLALKFGASLHLLHVLESPVATGPFPAEMYLTDMPGVQMALMKDAQERLTHRVRPSDRAHYAATSEVIIGRSAQVIVSCAAERKIDLIVMGTHGRTGLAHMLMGSVAEHVVRTAPCPVLTVRETPVTQKEPAGVTAATVPVTAGGSA